MAAKIEVGDFYSIPLPDGRIAYAQFMQFHHEYGYLVRILDQVSEKPLSVAELSSQGSLFPPVFVNVAAALKEGRWKRIGKGKVELFVFPTFRVSPNAEAGTYENWWLWNGKEHTFIGKLPKELRSLEVECRWGYESLAERIATGINYWDRVK